MYGSIGMNLKVLRLRNRLKQNEVARKTGISVYLISHYERNEMIPNEEKIKKLAEFYGVTVDEITEEST
ncbi:helix-turn-helix transcriptional regulator [Cytobacillus sp. FSL W8-0315]|uniref:helix-turn-helix domain-containing protein n=1 Tax=Cytobacillus sp. FSL W8-0315 TaxID=2921600 RepID=UPI0030FD167D